MAKRSRSIYLIAFLLFAGGLGYMIWSGVSQNGVYFLNVSEALAMESESLHSARLFGTVAKDEILRPNDGLGATFKLQDANNTDQFIEVSYKGVVPDTFDVGSEVIIEGSFQQKNKFVAKTLMTKCPSKYQKENREKNNIKNG